MNLMPAMLCSLGLSGWLGAAEVVAPHLDDPATAMAELKLSPEDWLAGSGELRTVGAKGRVVSATLGQAGWADYEVAFALRRLQVHPGDQHVGLMLRDGDGASLRLYTRGDTLIYLEQVGGRTLRHDVLGRLPRALGEGADAPAMRLRCVLAGRSLRVFVDGAELGILTDLAPAEGRIALYAYNADAAFSDLRVLVTRSAVPAAAGPAGAGANILPNSSFEDCTLDGLPDSWGCKHWGIGDPWWVTHFPLWTACFGTTTEGAFHGRRCMRVVNPREQADAHALMLRTVTLGTKVKQPYTLSAWLRCEPAGMRVSLNGREVRPGAAWGRFSTAFVNADGSLGSDTVGIHPLEKGTVWVDAVQLEPGALSDYRPLEREIALATQEGNQEKTITAVPEAQPPRLQAASVLDGVLDEAVWQQAARLPLGPIDGGPAISPTEALLWYDDLGLHLGMTCPGATAPAPERAPGRDQSVWLRPSIELFLDPSLSRNYYLHLGVDQSGAQYDANGGDMSWNGTWSAATATNGSTWTAEIFLPFADLGIDRATAGRWGLNVCRNDPAAKACTCWSPTGGSFHTPTRFGQILLDPAALDPYRVGVTAAVLRRASPTEAGLEVEIANTTPADGAWTLAATLTDEAGAMVLQTERLLELRRDQRGRSDLGLLPCPAGEKRYDLALSLRSADGQLRHASTRYLNAPGFLTVQTRFATISGDAILDILARIEADAGLLGRGTLAVSVLDAAGAEVATAAIAQLAGENRSSVPTAALPPGDYRVRIGLSDGGRVLETAEAGFTKVAAAANEVRIDRFTRSLTVRGKPFLPLGFYWEGEITREVQDYLAANGSNAIVIPAYRIADPEQVARLLDDSLAAGLMARVGISGREAEQAARIVARCKDHPALLGWDVFDEVFTGAWGRANHGTVVGTCAGLQRLDPHHPVHINENQYGLSWLKSKKLAFPGSIVSIDYYAFPPGGNLQQTIDHVRLMEEMGRASGAPSWIYLLGAGYAFWASRDYTPAEQEFSTYASVIGGVRGVFWFASHPKSRSQWRRINGLMTELKELAPMLLGGRTLEGLRCSAPGIECAAFEHDGAIHLLAVNSSRERVEARFELPAGTALLGPVAVRFEDRCLDTVAGGLADSFAGFQRHVYLIPRR